MKVTLLSLGFIATTFANIIFHHVPLSCNTTSTRMYHGCLRGQQCTEDGECVALKEIRYPLSFRSEVPQMEVRAAVYSTDGSCGPAHGNTVCDPNSKSYTGGCCSQFGWCGNTADHCGTGCISGCTASPSTPASTGTAPRPDGQCGRAFGGATCDPKGAYGGCCSQYGFCGSTPQHCLASNGCQNGCNTTSSSTSISTSTSLKPTTKATTSSTQSSPISTLQRSISSTKTTTSSSKAATSSSKTTTIPSSRSSTSTKIASTSSTRPSVTTKPTASSSTSVVSSSTAVPPRSDGQCGSKFGGATCDPKGSYGGCCSQFGYCGTTTDHCLVANGCQNGCSDGAGSGATPTSTTAEPVIGGASTSMAPVHQATAAVTTDGSCGGSNNNTICGNWPNGNCCSMYGFCGQTSAHCGAGCQSGNCLNAPAVAAPGPSPAPANPSGGGSFTVIGNSGVAAMHAALMPNGRVMFLDKLEDYSQLKNPNGYFAMSSEYDPVTNQVVPLTYVTNAFCSGGTFLADGRVVSLGGNAPLTWLDPNIGDGFDAIRYLGRSPTDNSLNGQGWSEPGNKLASKRWYATAQTMPDATIFVASGSLNGLDPTVQENNNPTYEILSATGVSQGKNVPMQILQKNQPYYMYPFVHLLVDGTIFIFTSKSSQVFNVGSNAVVKELPDLPGDYRTYPNTGGSVLLPLSSSNNWQGDVVICGGGAYQDLTSPTDPSCGRIQPLATNPSWEMDSMPEGRGMVEATLLPDGTVLWLNGGNRGAQGFLLMGSPTQQALLYTPSKPRGQRWTTLANSDIPRLYHSVALLMLDGTVMVTGSSPNEMPKLQTDAQHPYVTEYRVERYIPPYLQGDNANKRPTNIVLSTKSMIANSSKFTVTCQVPTGAQSVKVVLYHGGFVTHSVHMGHRMLELDVQGWAPGGTQQTLSVTNPPNRNAAPPGPYVVYVVVDGTPGIGQFVQVA